MKCFGWFIAVVVFLLMGCTEPSTSVQKIATLKDFRGLAVLMSDYSAPSEIAFHDGEKFIDVRVPAHYDSRLRWVSALKQLFVIQRIDADSFFTLDLETGTQGKEISILRGLNVQDVLPVSSESMWVSALNSKEIAEVGVRTGDVFRGVALPLENRGEGEASDEPSFLVQSGNTVGVYFQMLKDYVPSEKPAQLLRWQVDGRALAPVNLKFKNPITEFKRYRNHFYLGEAGYRMGARVTGREIDGGIQELDKDLNPGRVVVTEAELGGDLLDFDIIDNNFAVAAVSIANADKTSDAKLVAFDPATGKAKDPAVFPPTVEKGYRFVQVLWNARDGRLLVADKGSASGVQPKIRVFDSRMVELPKEAILLNAPPVQMVVVEP